MKIAKLFHLLSASVRTTTLTVAATAVAGVIGIAYVTAPTDAALNASAFNTSPQSIISSGLSLALAVDAPSAGFTTSISGMIPGDTQYRFVTYTQAAGNATAITPTLQITDGASTLLTADSIRGLAVAVNNCSVAWTYTLGINVVPTCSGTLTAVLGSTPLVTLKSATALGAGFNLTPGSVSHLAYTIVEPTGVTETTANGTATVGSNPYAITAISASGSTVTYSTASTTGLVAGEQITVSGATTSGFNGTFIITAVTAGTSFAVANVTTGATSTATGTLPTIQNLTSTVTWTVAEVQRASTSTNG